MSFAVHQKLVLSAIICLLLYQVGLWIAAVAGVVWGAGSALVVGVVTYVCARLARRGVKSSIWFMLPTLLFTLVPLVISVWGAVTTQASVMDSLVSLVPLLVGFVIPVALLSTVYLDLRRKAG